ncbi:MAG: hypothetical protein CMF28_00935 [Kiritimatiellaceae bacterium]|nr:hypothetical protein [Kiritimatiellaceae bacterium]|tara:strand:+ start:175 stop:981 length:807 start_codon:yes stop_codon:yes gene_type:complete
MNNSTPETGSYDHRFSGIRRLYGVQQIPRIQNAHFAIIGIGGVGSWAAESLARTGIGTLTLIDWDDICLSNTNRQIHAHTGTAGQPKVDQLAQRIHLINPHCTVHAQQAFYTPQTAHELISPNLHYVLDAIDNKNAKIHLINHCRNQQIPIITCGGAGGRIDPTQIRTADLGQSNHDPLLTQIRKQLRKDFSLPKEKKVHFGIPCVYSAEPMRYPDNQGNICTQKPTTDDGPRQLDCAAGFGSITHLTGSIGFAMAAHALNDYLANPS